MSELRLANVARMHVHRSLTLSLNVNDIVESYVFEKPKILEHKIVEGQIMIQFRVSLKGIIWFYLIQCFGSEAESTYSYFFG